MADEIEELNADKLKLEAEIQQKEAGIRVKNNEIKNLQVSNSLAVVYCVFYLCIFLSYLDSLCDASDFAIKFYKVR